MLDSQAMEPRNPSLRRATTRSPSLRPSRRGRLGWVALVLGAVVLLGCQPTGTEDSGVQREEFEIFLADYLPRLGQAYAQRDPSLLDAMAVEKELAKIEARTTELAAAGRIYKPELVQLTVEDFTIWNHSNAFVSTFEVWDIRSYTVGTDILLQESLGQRNRVKYQLKRRDDSWVVLYRELGETIDS